MDLPDALPTDILLFIAELGGWRGVVQMAGTCRELRKKVLDRHWSVPFATTNADIAMNVLSLYKFNDISLNMRDDLRFRELGAHIARTFGDTTARVRLCTDSFFLMEGMSIEISLMRESLRLFDELEFGICSMPISNPDDMYEMLYLSNVRKLDMFCGWREVSFRCNSDIDDDEDAELFKKVAANAVYAARDCTVLNIYEFRPPQLFVDEVHVYGPLVTYAGPYCKKLFLHHSTIAYGKYRCGMYEEIHIDADSSIYALNSAETVFPNAKIYGIERFRQISRNNKTIEFIPKPYHPEIAAPHPFDDN